MIIVRAFGKGRKISSLRQSEFIDRFAKIIERGGGDAVIAQAKIDFIQVELQNALFGVSRLNFKGDQHFLDFTIKGLLG